MPLSDFESALTAAQTAANQLDVDNAAKSKTAAALQVAQQADTSAGTTITMDTTALQTALDKVISEAVANGLKINVPPAA